MSRFPDLDREDLTPRQQQTFDRIANGPREGVRGPFEAWVRSPEFADRAEALGRFIRFESSIEHRLNEMAILMVARHWNAVFAWNGHLALARDAGLGDDIVEALRRGDVPPFHDAGERAVYDFVGQLLEHRVVSDAAWKAAVEAFGDTGVVDLIGVTGYYSMVAMTLVASRIGGDLPNIFSKD